MQPIVVQKGFNVDSFIDVKVFDKGSYLLPWHQHDAFELNYIVRGVGQRMIGNQIDTFKAGDMLLLGPRLPHAWKEHDQQELQGIKAITVKFDEAFQHSVLNTMHEFAPILSLLNKASSAVVIPDTLQAKLTDKIENLLMQTPARQLLSVLDILLTISEHETTTLLPDNKQVYQGVESQRAKDAINHIFATYLEPLDVSILADIAGVHPSSLGRLFKKNTGYSPTEFINQVRVNHACNLLMTTKLSVLEISSQSGYQNLSYFNRIFKLLKGDSPSAYKKKIRQSFQ
jgi:YesN/AraC family two-component response regulator